MSGTEAAGSSLVVSIAGDEAANRVEVGGELTFGRSPACDLVIAPEDPAVSRIAGTILWTGTAWEVHNRSTSRPLYRVEDTGLRTAIPVGGRAVLVDPVTRIAVVGSVLTHVITLELSTARPGSARPVVLPGTETAQPLLTHNEFRALVALLEGYLREHPRHEPRPRTYAEAAERLGVPAATVRKRIERVREKLVDSGVVELRQADARLAMAEFVLSTRLVTARDLAILDDLDLGDDEAAGRPSPGT